MDRTECAATSMARARTQRRAVSPSFCRCSARKHSPRSAEGSSSLRSVRTAVELGYEPALGARPLRRAILKQVQAPLAESLLGNKYAEGTTIQVGLDGEKFTFKG